MWRRRGEGGRGESLREGRADKGKCRGQGVLCGFPALGLW